MTDLLNNLINIYDNLIDVFFDDYDVSELIEARDDYEITRGRWNRLVESLPYHDGLL